MSMVIHWISVTESRAKTLAWIKDDKNRFSSYPEVTVGKVLVLIDSSKRGSKAEGGTNYPLSDTNEQQRFSIRAIGWPQNVRSSHNTKMRIIHSLGVFQAPLINEKLTLFLMLHLRYKKGLLISFNSVEKWAFQ